MLEEPPGVDVTGGAGGAAGGQQGDVPRAAPQRPGALAAGGNCGEEGTGVRRGLWEVSPPPSCPCGSYRTPCPGWVAPARGRLPSGCGVRGRQRGRWGPTTPPPAGAGCKLGGEQSWDQAAGPPQHPQEPTPSPFPLPLMPLGHPPASPSTTSNPPVSSPPTPAPYPGAGAPAHGGRGRAASGAGRCRG